MSDTDTPSDRKKTLKMSLRAKWGPGLDLPKKGNQWVSNNILRQPLPGRKYLNQDCPHLPSKVERTQRLSTESVQTQRGKSERETVRGGRTLTKNLRLLALNTSNTSISSSIKCYWKGKMPNVVSKRSSGLLPHATSHSQMYMAEPKGHTFEKRKTRKSPVVL